MILGNPFRNGVVCFLYAAAVNGESGLYHGSGAEFSDVLFAVPIPLPSWVQKGRIGLTRNLRNVMLALTVS